MSDRDRPTLNGRFNYVLFMEDKFDIVFTTWDRKHCYVIANNLTREQAKDMMEDLNEVMKDYRDELRELPEKD